MKERIFISKSLYEGKTGGGNNFLRILNENLRKSGHNSSKARFSTTILISSHHNIIRNLITKLMFPQKKFIIRIDGKSSLHRSSIYWDRLVEWQAKYLADSIIYQSEWSRNIWKDRLKTLNKPSIVILNSCDSEIFYPRKQNNRLEPEIRIISSANSSNKNKGMKEIYKLDALLAKTMNKRYSINIFGFGVTSKQFHPNNIILNPIIEQRALANEIRKSDIFFAPFIKDSCSNSIIEALACGVPVLALNSGANGELVNENGLLYGSNSELEKGILRLIAKLEKIQLISIKKAEFYNRDISHQYTAFAGYTDKHYMKSWRREALSRLLMILANRFLEKLSILDSSK